MITPSSACLLSYSLQQQNNNIINKYIEIFGNDKSFNPHMTGESESLKRRREGVQMARM